MLAWCLVQNPLGMKLAPLLTRSWHLLSAYCIEIRPFRCVLLYKHMHLLVWLAWPYEHADAVVLPENIGI